MDIEKEFKKKEYEKKDYLSSIKLFRNLSDSSLPFKEKRKKIIEKKRLEAEKIPTPTTPEVKPNLSLDEFRKYLIDKEISSHYNQVFTQILSPPGISNIRMATTFTDHYENKLHLYKEYNANLKQQQKLAEAKINELISIRKKKLSSNEINIVDKYFSSYNQSSVIIDKFNVPFKVIYLQTLKPGTWLNDEVINFYMSMLSEYDEARPSPPGINKNHYFSSFFMAKYFNVKDFNGSSTDSSLYSYSNIKRWTKKFNVFEKNKIFFPVNRGNSHWTLSYIDITKKEIHYIDSMNHSGRIFLLALLDFLEHEAIDKELNKNFKRSEWTLIDSYDHNPPVPQQNNGYDCGMFSIICADYLTDDLPLRYTNSEMGHLRYKVAYSITRGSLPYLTEK